MQNSNRGNRTAAFLAGVAFTALAGVLMGQGASQPVKSEAQYFVTAHGDGAHLWVREGAALRVIGHAECSQCAAKDHNHKEGDDHDHDHPAPTK